jgi:SAM-dependent methyltransferase
MRAQSTIESFKAKWENNPDLAFAETLREGSKIPNWILERNGFADKNALREYLKTKRSILDAGCGNGRVTALLRENCSDQATIVAIDISSASIAGRNLSRYKNIKGCKKDILGRFDFIYCQEVLHHVSDPLKAFLNLCSLLTPDGEIAIHVYRKKAPIREFVDDYIRGKMKGMPYEEAIKMREGITQLGKLLTRLDTRIAVPDIDVIGIEAGEYDVQRFLCHFITKCFWNPDLTFDENTAINYDCYHPQIAARLTVEEVREWFSQAALSIVHEHADHYGITMRGRKQ